MKVNSNINSSISFNGFYNNKILKKSLEFASDNSALCQATTVLVCSGVVRPLVTLLTPNTNKENKQLASAKHISSCISQFLITYLLAKPLTNSIEKIDKNPTKYLEKDTIKNLGSGKNLLKSKPYNLATNILKLSVLALAVFPKAIMTVLGIPYITKNLFKNNDINELNKNQDTQLTQDTKSNDKFARCTFKGSSKLTEGIAKILNNKTFQDFSKKHKDSNMPLHIMNGTDILSTGVTVTLIQNSTQINDDKKPALIWNTVVSTMLSVVSAYSIDKITKKPTEKFVEKFKQVNKEDPKLYKYLNGIKILKPILILAGVYYTIIPLVSTYLADRITGTNVTK